ncbi:hypothetical protein GLOIN_2v1495217 [Rhizophagus clarus]|uniref:Uncharacterized protein n=1 Tax=Rhizophagus clarus TaxID=94130 RepID=A0A8H3L968_9GLOM|nr:hypothetical protein GLOIN_2v1495217 [Rhizophagus clarus]
MSKSKQIHKYFERKTSEWNIIGFLGECNIEPFRKKIKCYLLSLESIPNTEEGRRGPYELLYSHKASVGTQVTLRACLCSSPTSRPDTSPSRTQGPDSDLARDWEEEHRETKIDGSLIYVHQPTFNGGTNNIGIVQDGTFISGSKRDQEEEEDEEPKQKKARFHKERSKEKLSSGRGNTLRDGTKLEKPNTLMLIPSDDDNSSQDDDDSSQRNDSDDDVPPPEEALDFVLKNQRNWILPSKKNVGDIVAKKISANARATKKKKRLSAVERAMLRYGSSQIIYLSAHMKGWFSLEDREFMMRNYESLLQVPNLTDEESSFITTVENMLSKIYFDFIYRSEDGSILDPAHTEFDVILKACSYIVEGLRKGLLVQQRWGESFCTSSRSIDYKKGRKCDVRFLSPSGIDVGEWEFASNATPQKAISDRCRSARINQSILNSLLSRNLTDVQAKKINVAFLQIAGTSGQMLFEDLIEGFYVVFPGPKFELPTKLQHIEKLKSSVKIIKYVMDMYEQVSEIVETKESTSNAFDSIFDSDELDTSRPTHCKSEYIREPWWTPKNKAKVTDNK